MIKYEDLERDCCISDFAGFEPDSPVFLQDVLQSVEDARVLLIGVLHDLPRLAYTNTLWSKGLYEVCEVLNDLGAELRSECNEYEKDKERREKMRK